MRNTNKHWLSTTWTDNSYNARWMEYCRANGILDPADADPMKFYEWISPLWCYWDREQKRRRQVTEIDYRAADYDAFQRWLEAFIDTVILNRKAA